LDLNDKQRTACLQHAGAARWAYNFGLRRKQEAYVAGQKTPTAVDLHRELVVLKHSTVAWLGDVSKCAPQQALRNLDAAYTNFFRRCKTGAKKKGYPKFKSRKRGIGSFMLEGAVRATARTITLPRIGTVRLKEHGYIPRDATIKSVVVSERAGRWFVAVRTAEPEPVLLAGSEALGVDVGIKNLAALSDGTVFENPKALRKAQYRLRQRQKAVSRKPKGSSNRRKAVQKLAKQHYRVACVRNDAIHKATAAITKRAAVLGIESLNIAGMMKNHHLAGALADASLSEFHRQLEYKMKWHGGAVIKADRFFPSSKTCSSCGRVKDVLSLSERVFRCECGFVKDRDVNAAINLKNLAVSSTATACCPGGSGRDAVVSVKPLVGQEPNAVQDVVLNG
jgi:putative transposase